MSNWVERGEEGMWEVAGVRGEVSGEELGEPHSEATWENPGGCPWD